MDKRFYGVIIRSRHLDAMRRFFAETVGLGDPVVNSNFWLEFELPGTGMILAVTKDETAVHNYQRDEGNTCWCLCVDDLPDFEKQMTDSGFGPEGEVLPPGQGKALIFRDPDGNRFLVKNT